MGIPLTVGLCLTGICLVLLIIALVQLNKLRSALSEIDQRVRKVQRAAEDNSRVERAILLTGNLLEQMSRLDAAVAALRATSSRPPPSPASPPLPVPPPPPLPPPAERATGAWEATTDLWGDRGGFTARAIEQSIGERAPAVPSTAAPAGESEAKPWVPPASEPVPEHRRASEHDEGLLSEYRELIAQLRKADINRWTDDHEGESCEATEDGAFRPLDRDSGGLLVLVPLDRDRAMVLPAGRLVVDFATNYANSLSLRSVTRHTFELVEDGSGVLRLVEPAYAERREGVWRLARPGRVSGLNPA